MRQNFMRWFVDYPSTHERAGQTVEVVPYAEYLHLRDALERIKFGNTGHLDPRLEAAEALRTVRCSKPSEGEA